MAELDVKLPKGTSGWIGFIIASFVAGIVIQSVLRRVPALQQFTGGI